MSDAYESSSSTAKAGAKVTPLTGGATRNPAEDPMARLASTFETSARRWELIVYPALFAFIVLASYGFYLIFSLTTDVGSLARNVSVLTQSIDRMTTNMDGITVSMRAMDGKMDNLEPMRVSMGKMNHSMEQMNFSTNAIASSAEGMRHQMGTINHNMRPIGQFGSFMPW